MDAQPFAYPDSPRSRPEIPHGACPVIYGHATTGDPPLSTDHSAPTPSIVIPAAQVEPSNAVGFPARLAAIDVGSNAIRMLAAEFRDSTSYSVLRRDRGAVRLGHGSFAAGVLAPEAMDAAVATLTGFRRRMEELGVERYRAVATSAVRESANSADFTERVRREAGLELEVIGGDEEAALVRRAVGSRIELAGRTWALVDVGGGSTELVAMDGAGVVRSGSYPLGAVRLLEEFPPAEESLFRFWIMLAERAAAHLLGTLPGGPEMIGSIAHRPEPAGMIAVGGNIEALARLAGHSANQGVASLHLAELHRLIERIAGLSYRQRIEELGLREDRADVILPASVLYEYLAMVIGADTLLVPWVGVREGVLLALAEVITTETDTPRAPSSGPPR
ncbi:exopolyphosphatase [soil metagenome]